MLYKYYIKKKLKSLKVAKSSLKSWEMPEMCMYYTTVFNYMITYFSHKTPYLFSAQVGPYSLNG